MDELEKNENYTNETFENIKHIDDNGIEFWYARELQSVLSYKEWRKFENVIKKAKESCENSDISIDEQFVGVDKLSKRANNAEVVIKDYKLTRYACYLIAQNGDSRKKVIALAQTYFAVQTRKQEITEKEYAMLTEDEKRFYQRKLTRRGNYSLNQTAKKAGVKNFDKFHNAGYKGLYNGETADDIAKRKGLRYREDILDNMGSEELAANLFRITQTESKLKRDNVHTEKDANSTHYRIGKNIREVIKKNGGTMPEDLPTPKKSLKELEKENKNYLKITIKGEKKMEEEYKNEIYKAICEVRGENGILDYKYTNRMFDYIDDALELVDEGNYDRAFIILKSILDLIPEIYENNSKDKITEVALKCIEVINRIIDYTVENDEVIEKIFEYLSEELETGKFDSYGIELDKVVLTFINNKFYIEDCKRALNLAIKSCDKSSSSRKERYKRYLEMIN